MGISPHAWGWPVCEQPLTVKWLDFPTRVGMALVTAGSVIIGNGFPHTRGDGPKLGREKADGMTISPHAWGWPAMAVPLRRNT